MKVNPETRRVH